MSNDPMVNFCHLYKKVSKTGNEYFTGRVGFARVLMFKDTRFDGEGERWVVRLAQAEDRPQQGAQQGAQQGQQPAQAAESPRAQPRGNAVPGGRPSTFKDLDDEIPF